jgi:uncharacterized protein YuzE
MKIESDNEVDALYIRIQEKEVSHTKELEEGVNLDMDESNKILYLSTMQWTKQFQHLQTTV